MMAIKSIIPTLFLVCLSIILFTTSTLASPVPSEPQDIDLGFRKLSSQQKPLANPIKLYVHAGPACHSGKTHLFYLPENKCIGPLYHPTGSLKLMSDLPKGCIVKGFTDGYCRGSDVGNNLKGPADARQCVDIGGKQPGEGVNSLRVECGH